MGSEVAVAAEKVVHIFGLINTVSVYVSFKETFPINAVILFV